VSRDLFHELFEEVSGQAMAEYAIIVAALVLGSTGLGYRLLPEFINALQQYYDNFYIMINLPVP
jgi:hypothetical protein